jgi:4a-hydroxytetrahydrobiopterin dehydratase
MSDLIAEDEIDTWMKKVPEWEVEGGALCRSIEFDEFNEGIDFVDGVAEIAEEAQHHPDIDIRWTTIILRLTTHEVGGITSADFELASRIDNLID